MKSTDPSPTPGGRPSVTSDALPAGTRLGELEVLHVLGTGGFGIVYLAQDHSLDRRVALKEYLPGSLAGRGDDRQVTVRSESDEATHALGLRSFVNEARLLARFDHPSLVKVYRFWEGNGTAYMVMPLIEGRTLRDVRRSMTEPPGQAWILGVLRPLLDALEQLHREAVFHRDIAPDNILLPPGDLPVLLDFGAARRAIGDRTQSFTAILKPSYAPIEQYADAVATRQGPWTDLYALGAVACYLLNGVPPPPATTRALHDDGPIAWGTLPSDVTPAFVAAVDWMLAVRPADRPQSVAELRAVLDGRATIPPRAARPTDAAIHAAPPLHRAMAPVPDGDATLVLRPPSTDDQATLVHARPARPAADDVRPTSAVAPSPAGSRRGLTLAVLVGVLLLVVLAGWLLATRL